MKALTLGLSLLALAAAACASGGSYSSSGQKPDTFIYPVAEESECPARLAAAAAREADDETVVVQPNRICMTHTQILVQCQNLRMAVAVDNLRRIDMRNGSDQYGAQSWANGMNAITLRMDRQTRRFCSYVRQEYGRVSQVTAPGEPTTPQLVAPSNP